MVKVTNNSDRVLSRRHPSGTIFKWAPRESKEVESSRLLEEVSRQECFTIGKEVGTKNVGGGLKTHVRPPKRLSRPDKPRKHLDKGEQAPKEKVKCPKGSYKCKGVCKCDTVKKPKGLKKSKKGIGIDLDGDGKVDVIVGKDD